MKNFFKSQFFILTQKIKRYLYPEWPIINNLKSIEPCFVFLLTLPYTGSTAIAKIFLTSNLFDSLTDNAEGQWLIPALTSSDRWDENKYINTESLRSVWVEKCQILMNKKKINFFIEKSPPNLVRIDLIQKIFPNNILIANNRNPYASISSALYRESNLYDIYFEKLRRNKISKLTKNWIERSYILYELIQKKKFL